MYGYKLCIGVDTNCVDVGVARQFVSLGSSVVEVSYICELINQQGALKLELFVLYLRVLPHTLLATNIRLAFVGFNFTFDMCMCQHQ